MVLIIEGFGFLIALSFVIAFFFMRGPKRKMQLAICALIVLAGFGGAAVIAREGIPIISHPAPLSASAQVIFTGTSFEGQMAIESLNAGDGSMRWRHLFDIRKQTVPPTPVVSGNTIYLVASDQTRTALVLYALRSENGDILWSRLLGSYGRDAIWNGDGPLPLDGQVFIAVGHDINMDAPAVGTTTLYALRADTGAPVWSQQLNSVDYHSIDDPVQDPSVLAADEGRLFVNETDGHVHALRASDGVEIWSAAGGIGTMGVDSGVLYQRGGVSDPSYIALRESDGARLWVQRFVSVHALAVEGHYLVAVTMSGPLENPNGYLTGMNAGDGTVLWQNPIGSTDVMPVISNGVIYLADHATLDAVRISDGHALWQEHIPDLTASEIDEVAVSPHGNVVVALTSPIIGEDPLFDPATCSCYPHDKVFALDARDGSAYWQYQPPLTSSTEGFFGLAVN